MALGAENFRPKLALEARHHPHHIDEGGDAQGDAQDGEYGPE